MYVCMYVCIYVCMYVCRYVCTLKHVILMEPVTWVRIDHDIITAEVTVLTIEGREY